MRAASTAIAGACALTLALAACNTPNPGGAALEVAASWWKLEADGDLKVSAGTAGTGTRADVDDDLGIGRDDTWTARLDVTNGANRVGVEYLPLQLSGDTHASKAFVFEGTRYPAGDDVSTDLELGSWVVRWDHSVSTSRRSEDAFRVGAGFWWWSFDAQVKGATSGNDERRSFSKVYPEVHANAVFDLSHGLLAELGGALAFGGRDRRIWDLGGSVGYRVSDGLKVGIGYRWIAWDVEEGAADLDFALRGPLATLTLRF